LTKDLIQTIPLVSMIFTLPEMIRVDYCLYFDFKELDRADWICLLREKSPNELFSFNLICNLEFCTEPTAIIIDETF